jgi:hypothetical protein
MNRFLTANIDRAIVMTQYDLRGFLHPLGMRMEYKASPKSLSATTTNLVAFAAGRGHGDRKATVKNYVGFDDSSFKEYLAMCKKLAGDCDCSQKEAIQLIVKEIIQQSEQMKSEVALGERKTSAYLEPLRKNNYWGKAVLALVEAFEVKLNEIKA